MSLELSNGTAETSERLREEITQLRNRVAELEADASGRQHTEAALRESRDLFQSFMNNSPLLASMKDDDGRYVYANRVIDEVLPGRSTEWWGKTDHDLWPEPAARQLRANDLQALEADRMVALSETLPQSDGEHQWITFKFPFTAHSGKRYIGGLSLDVTSERKARSEAEAALAASQRSETRARQLFESNVIGIVEIDGECLLDANNFFLTMTGYAREDLTAGRLHWRGMTPSQFHDRDDRAGDELLRTGRCAPFEKEIVRKDGTAIPILIGGTAVNGDDSRKSVCFVLDLTERKQLEHRLLHAQKLESLGLLAGGVAHDFNNMLASMMGNASLSLEELSPSHPAYQTLAEVIIASRRASDLTQQLLAYSGRARFVVNPIDLTELVGEIGKLVESVMSKKIDLRLRLARDLPHVDADSAQMQQVIMNLVINASEAIGENPGTVEVSTRAWDLKADDIGLHFPNERISPGPHVHLQVRDTGCGMSGETQARIFDPFFTTKANGHGLGLAAVLGIVRSHRGVMRVDSAAGVGTKFQLLFPASRELPVTTGGVAQSSKTLSGDGLVLVVDDEDAVRRMAKATLERYGYTVMIAEDGRQAVEIFSRLADRISVVLLDLAMPVMNGREAARQMMEIQPNSRILITSGYNESEATDWIEREGLSGFIQKPYTATQLAEQIKAATKR